MSHRLSLLGNRMCSYGTICLITIGMFVGSRLSAADRPDRIQSESVPAPATSAQQPAPTDLHSLPLALGLPLPANIQRPPICLMDGMWEQPLSALFFLPTRTTSLLCALTEGGLQAGGLGQISRRHALWFQAGVSGASESDGKASAAPPIFSFSPTGNPSDHLSPSPAPQSIFPFQLGR